MGRTITKERPEFGLNIMRNTKIKVSGSGITLLLSPNGESSADAVYLFNIRRNPDPTFDHYMDPDPLMILIKVMITFH